MRAQGHCRHRIEDLVKIKMMPIKMEGKKKVIFNSRTKPQLITHLNALKLVLLTQKTHSQKYI